MNSKLTKEQCMSIEISRFEKISGMKLSEDEYNDLMKRFELHDSCFLSNKEDYSATKDDIYDPEETFEVVTYGENVSLECTRCNTVIIDTDVLELERDEYREI